MAPGSIVVYLADPLLYGKMIIVDATENGLLVCECIHRDATGDYPREAFDPHELELAAKWSEAVA
jgi:hypothetical protein